MEAEDESVKPTENKCDWCGKPSGTDEYCCKKCKYELHKFYSSGRFMDNVLSAFECLSDFGRVIPVILCALLLGFIPVLLVHGALMFTNKTFSSLVINIYNWFKHSHIAENMSPANSRLIGFLVQFSPTYIAVMAVLIKGWDKPELYLRWVGVIGVIAISSLLSGLVWPQGNSMTHPLILVLGIGFSIYRVCVE